MFCQRYNPERVQILTLSWWADCGHFQYLEKHKKKEKKNITNHK